jgi:hypothetical protein
MAPVRGTPYGMAYARCTPVRDTPMRDAYELAAYELAAYELAACEMAYVRGMLMRCTPIMRDGPCERHAYEMAYERCTPMGDTSIGWLL